MSSQRRIDRFTAFLDITGHRDRLSYQTYQGFLAIADGGLTGSGVGAGNSKLGYLPLAHSDFIFAVIADELGFVGTLAVLGGFALLVWFGIQAALAAPDRFGMLLAGGIAAWFGVQAIVNTGGVVRAVAGHRPDAAVLLGRRLVAVRVDDRRRPAAQRRPPRRRECVRPDTFAVITGGGTAGHVLPALAIAEELEERGHPRRLAALRRRPARHRDAPAPRDAVSAHVPRRRRRATTALSRATPPSSPSSSGPSATARRLLQRAAAAGRRVGRRLRQPAGGAGGPAAAHSGRRRLVRPAAGTGQRPGRPLRRSVAPWRSKGRRLPRAVVTGAPVRRAIRDVDRVGGPTAARAALGLPADRFVLAVTGGSQGSGALNEAIVAYAAEHDGDAGLAIYHVAGERFAADGRRPTRSRASGVVHRVVGYEPRIDLVYAAADLLVGRGGASTVAEVAVTGTPSILVPWAGGGRGPPDRQRPLARRPGRRRAPARGPTRRLGVAIDELRGNAEPLAELAGNARAAGAVHRRGALGALIERVALPEPAKAGQ